MGFHQATKTKDQPSISSPACVCVCHDVLHVSGLRVLGLVWQQLLQSVLQDVGAESLAVLLCLSGFLWLSGFCF